MSFQENLIHYREKAGYKSAKDFARKLGINYTTYMGYENKNREPKYSLLMKIAKLLNVTIDDLLGYDPAVENIQSLKTKLSGLGFSLEELPGTPHLEKPFDNLPIDFWVSDSWNKTGKKIILSQNEIIEILKAVENGDQYKQLFHQLLEIQFEKKATEKANTAKYIYGQLIKNVDSDSNQSQEEKNYMKAFLKEIFSDQDN